jgi:hypothetical protein
MATLCLQSSPAECVTDDREYSSIPVRAGGRPHALRGRRSCRKGPRLDLIARIRAEIAVGTCDTDEKLSAAIDDLLR